MFRSSVKIAASAGFLGVLPVYVLLLGICAIRDCAIFLSVSSIPLLGAAFGIVLGPTLVKKSAPTAVFLGLSVWLLNAAVIGFCLGLTLYPGVSFSKALFISFWLPAAGTLTLIIPSGAALWVFLLRARLSSEYRDGLAVGFSREQTEESCRE